MHDERKFLHLLYVLSFHDFTRFSLPATISAGQRRPLISLLRCAIFMHHARAISWLADKHVLMLPRSLAASQVQL